MQLQEGAASQPLRSITLLSDRLYAGGYHTANTFEVLLRRSSMWADWADYPEPSRSTWTKEQNMNIQREQKMLHNASARKLREAVPLKDSYHRFFFLMNNNVDRELQNLRIEDEEPAFIDRMNFFVHFSLTSDETPLTPFQYCCIGCLM